MAAASLSLDQFSCAVCLDLLKDPVAIPCGHSYCMSCITGCWNQEDQKGVYSCPQCRQTFSTRPDLAKNTILAEVVEQLKKTKLHPQQHEYFFNGQLQEMICPKHNKQLEMYCHTDQQCICYLCTMDNHKNHDTVAAVAERTKKQAVLDERKRKFQKIIQQREKDLVELREAVKSHRLSAQTAVMDSERIFTELVCSIERRRTEVTQRIRDQETAAVSRAEGRMKQLEQEIDDLRRRDAELELLSNTDDHIHFLQSFQSLPEPPEPTDVPSITVSSLLSFEDLGKSVFQLKEKLEDFCREEIAKISGRAIWIEIIPTNEPKIREEFLQYFHLLTLDPNTANKHLHLSEGNRAVTFTDGVQQYPDHPDRFDSLLQVLCRESVCGRCYWEIEWSGGLGVAISLSYKGIKRKGLKNESVFGYNDQSWRLSCSPSSYSLWHNGTSIDFPKLPIFCRIGVFVDHSAGTLSFYSVSDTMSLIHRVQTTFTRPLYPGFGVYSESTVKLCDLTL